MEARLLPHSQPEPGWWRMGILCARSPGSLWVWVRAWGKYNFSTEGRKRKSKGRGNKPSMETAPPTLAPKGFGGEKEYPHPHASDDNSEPSAPVRADVADEILSARSGLGSCSPKCFGAQTFALRARVSSRPPHTLSGALSSSPTPFLGPGAEAAAPALPHPNHRCLRPCEQVGLGGRTNPFCGGPRRRTAAVGASRLRDKGEER